jgi:hypothetical protein
MNRATFQLPGPMRIVRAWLFRERAIRGPSAIELDVVDRQVTREEDAVSAATEDAAQLERRLQRVRDKVRGAMIDPVTPGVIDAAETRAIARELIGTSVAAHHHTEQLKELA